MSTTETQPKWGLSGSLVQEEASDISHICEDPDVRSLPRLSLQPPLGLELVCVFTPEGLIPIKPKPASVIRVGKWYVRKAHR